jgi:hypothetical protein
MERISGSLALTISEHRLGDALYALLLILLPRFSTDQVVAVPILTVCDLVPA